MYELGAYAVPHDNIPISCLRVEFGRRLHFLLHPPSSMRPSVRISFAGAAALIFLFTSLLSYYREVWRPASSANGLQTSRQYDASEPQEQPSSITSSSLGPEDALTRPTPVVIDTTSTPEQTKGVNLSTDHGTKTIVMAQLSTENTSWVHAELPEYVQLSDLDDVQLRY